MGGQETRGRRGYTAVTVVPDLGHAVVGGEDVGRVRIAKERGDKLFGLADNVVHHLDVVHVFLVGREQQESGENDEMVEPWSGVGTNVLWYPDQAGGGTRQPCRLAAESPAPGRS